MTVGVCKMCLRQAEIRKSHVIPALVARWLKKNTPGGARFVNLGSGRVREDFTRQPLFCDQCEQRMSKWETQFRDRILDAYFHQHYNFQRAEWLTRFAASLAFRVALVTMSEVDLGSPKRQTTVSDVLEQWRQYLVAPAGAVPPTTHELIFLNGKNVVPPPYVKGLDIPTAARLLSEYLITAVDATMVASDERVGVYVKLTAMLFWSPVEPLERLGWHGTRINGTGTIRARKQLVDSPFIVRLISQRLRQVMAGPPRGPGIRAARTGSA